MKKNLLLALLVSLTFLALGQTSGGPDLYGYTWKNSAHTTSPPAYQWIDISNRGAEVTGLSDDNIIGPITMSSPFQFYWYPVSQFWIGSNGYISFNATNMASPFPASIPLSSGGNNWIAPFLADLNFSGTGNTAQCYYLNTSDSLIVSWHNVPFWYNGGSGFTGSNTFQIVINKVDKSICFNYLSTNIGSNTTTDMIAGIENNTGNLGLGVMVDVMPTPLRTYKFYYPATVTYAVTDGGSNWNDNEKSAAIFIKKGGSPMPLTANFKNYGNQNLSSFTGNNTVYNPSNAVASSGTITVPALVAGDDTTLTFSNTFTAATAGIYRFKTSVSGITGDMVASNNSNQQRIVAIDTAQTSIYLDYSDGTPSGTGISWSGGSGGIGVYIKPPVYPCRILNSKFYITANGTSPVGFYAKLYDDSGPYNGPGALLDSVYVAPSGITIGTYKVVPTSNQTIILQQGGVYLMWDMAGDGIALGRDTITPTSRRTYEVLFNNWSEYRDKTTEDFLMGITIEKITLAAPVANFTVDSAVAPLFHFADQSTYFPNYWLWDFGDGTTASTQNTSHTYAANQTYNVCLISGNSIGSDTFCQSVYVHSVPTVAIYSYSSALMPTLSFTDMSTGNPYAWHWDFDDTGADSSDVQHPTYTFQTNGNHNICLTTTNMAGSSWPNCNTITISGVGIDEQTEATKVYLFPNPIAETAIIYLPSDLIQNGDIQLVCTNILGQIVEVPYSQSGNKVMFKKANLTTGNYHFQLIQKGNLVGQGRFIVQ